MKSRFPHILWLALALACGTALAEDGIRWAPDIETARKAAAQFNVPLLIHFYGDNCLPCKTLEQRVLSKPEAVETLNKYFICAKVNATQNIEIAREYQVHSWPTDVFISPDGMNLHQGVCQQDLQGYLTTLQHVAVMNRDRNVMLAGQKQLGGPMQGTYAAQQTYAGQVANAAQQQYSGRAPENPRIAAGQPNAAGAQPSLEKFPGPPSANSALSPAQQMAATGPSSTPSNPAPRTDLAPNNLVTHPNQNFVVDQRTAQVSNLLPSETRANVATGPMPAASQPQAIAGAVQSYQQQVAPNSPPPVSNSNNNGHLAPRTMAGYVATGPTPLAGRQAPMESFPGIPAVPANQPAAKNASALAMAGSFNGGNARSRPGFTQQNSVNAQLVSNPYYPGGASGPSARAVAAAADAAAADSAPQSTSAEVAASVAGPTKQPTSTPLESSSSNGTEPSDQVPDRTLLVSQPIAAAKPAEDNSQPGPESDAAEPGRAAPKEQVDHAPAIDGYCPVALRRNGDWVAGKPEYDVMHRGRVYWLSSQAALEEFLREPDANSPVLSGYDPLVFLEEGKLVEGDVQHGLHQQGTGAFLLFSTAESKKKYWEKFDYYSAALNAVLDKAEAN